METLEPPCRADVARVQGARRRVGALLVLALTCSPAMPAWAQRSPAEKAAAETLFDRGLAQLRAEDLSGACVSFEQSQRVDPAVGTLLYLAECYERTGRTASAWATFREAASLAHELRQSDRAHLAEARAKTLEPSLSRLVVSSGPQGLPPGVTMLRDGVPLSTALLGVPTPVDPGEHTLSVSAPDYEPWQQTFVATPGPSEIKLELPALQPAAQEVAPQPEAAPAPVAETPAPEPVPETSLTPVWILGGVGVAAVGVGTYFGWKAGKLDDDASEYCQGDRCFDRKGESLSSDARKAMIAADIGFGVGAAALLTGGILLFMHQDPQEVATVPVSLQADTHGATFTYGGAF